MIGAIYCVSLKRLAKRRIRQIDFLSKIDFCPVYFFDAVDGLDYDWSDFYKEGISEYKNWKMTKKECSSFGNFMPLYSVFRYWNRDVTRGEMGCSLGHYSVWKHAYENGYNNVLIFEDDVVLDASNMDLFTDCLNIFLKFIENNLYDVFYFGGSVIKDGEDINENIRRVLFMYCAHAYVLSNSAINVLLKANYLSNVIVIDEFLTSFFMPHPREDVRNLYYRERVLNAFRLKKFVFWQDDNIGSQTTLIR